MSAPVKVVVVPGVLALLPQNVGMDDPVRDLRLAGIDAVADLGDAVVLASSPSAGAVADYLLGAAALSRAEQADAYLVVANGSAKRTEKAPGHLDARALPFDADLSARLAGGELSGLDTELAAELWADVEALVELDRIVALDPASVRISYDDDPYGVQYWVLSATGTRR